MKIVRTLSIQNSDQVSNRLCTNSVFVSLFSSNLTWIKVLLRMPFWFEVALRSQGSLAAAEVPVKLGKLYRSN